MQYVNYSFSQNAGEGSNLPPGTQTPAAGAEPNAASATTLQKTLGFFVEEALAFNDRLFLTAAVRSDQNSAFGTDFQSVWYPKASISWIVSDEGFFPQASAGSTRSACARPTARPACSPGLTTRCGRSRPTR